MEQSHETIFDAIDAVSSQGLEAMLGAIRDFGEKQRDFTLIANASYAQLDHSLGYPSLRDLSDSVGVLVPETPAQQLLNAREKFLEAVSDSYKADEKLLEAARVLKLSSRREMREQAVVLYECEGTQTSFEEGAELAASLGDYSLALTLSLCFQSLEDSLSLLDPTNLPYLPFCEQERRYRTLMDAVTTAAVLVLKHEIKIQEGKEPEGDTISALLQGRQSFTFNYRNYSLDNAVTYLLDGSEDCADATLLQHCLDLVAFEKRRARTQPDLTRLEDAERYVRAKLTGDEDDVQYFVGLAKAHDGHTLCSERAAKLLQHLKRYDDALSLLEQSGPLNKLRVEITEQAGDTERLAALFREAQKPIEYALVRVGVKVSDKYRDTSLI